ncbi:hypothetical protein SDC9_65640 [bioreactor metagenome]|uniref:Uncharacterized protein n=1 Tax=bioreactor metagenome TaxID=1076179 RepID=A0A644XSK1_9ZZZZ
MRRSALAADEVFETGQDVLELLGRLVHRNRGALVLVEQSADHRGIMVDLDQPVQRGVVHVFAADHPDVDVGLGGLEILQVGVDRAGRIQVRIGGEVVVDDRAIQRPELDRGLVRIHRDHRHPRCAFVDVGRSRQRVAAVLERDQSGGLQDECAPTGVLMPARPR